MTEEFDGLKVRKISVLVDCRACVFIAAYLEDADGGAETTSLDRSRSYLALPTAGLECPMN